MASNALAKYEEKLRQSRERFKKYRQNESQVARVGIDAGVSAIAAFGIGYLETTNPDKMTIGGFHLSGVLGSLLLGAAIMGYAGAESDIVGSIGKGMLDAYAFEQGVAKGLAHNQAKSAAAK